MRQEKVHNMKEACWVKMGVRRSIVVKMELSITKNDSAVVVCDSAGRSVEAITNGQGNQP